MATLTDATLELHDRLIGTFFSKARSKHDREFAADGRPCSRQLARRCIHESYEVATPGNYGTR
jgi:hypothetical protein